MQKERKNTMIKIKELAKHCNYEERCRISKMLSNATGYIRAVVRMESIMEVHKLSPEDFEKAHQLAERKLCMEYDDFVSSVNDVNSICDTHGIPHVYVGSTDNGECCDYAMELIADIYKNRH